MSGANGSFGYPRELFHPNGFKTITVFDPAEHRKVMEEFDAYRQTNLAHEQASIRGETAPEPKQPRRRVREAPETTVIAGEE